MAARQPLVFNNGLIQALQAGDTVKRNWFNVGQGYTVNVASEAIDITNATSSLIFVQLGAEPDLRTINGGVLGDYIILKRVPGSPTITVINGSNLGLTANRTLDNDRDGLVLVFNGSSWLRVGLVT